MIRVLLCFLFCSSLFSSYITYEFSGGRFGDSLLCYAHAKWLSYKYGATLLYKPFPYSSELKFDDFERLYQDRSYGFGRKLSNTCPFPDPDRNDLYICPYFPEDPSDLWLHPRRYRFDVDWKDPEFRKMMRHAISPKHSLELATPPSARDVNIAIHIREGGGFDTDHTRLWDPLKLPPLYFYQEALQEIAALFKGRPLYCRLFTDALEPAGLIAELKKSAPKGVAIHFEARTEENHHTLNVLEDFFSFFEYDVLIHPQSNYSVVASRIHDFAATCSPHNFKRRGKVIEITERNLEVDEDLYQNVMQRTLR